MADEPITTGTDVPSDTTEAPASGGDSLRADIEKAFETVETRDAPPAAEVPPAGGPPAAAGERVRGADGRFLPGGAEAPPKGAEKAPATSSKPEAAAAPKPPLGAPQQPQAAPKAPPLPPEAAAGTPQARAPASWKPAAREHWAKLPPEVQQEVSRREVEVARTLNESSKAREALTHVQGALAPFSQNIAATGNDAIGAITQLFRADNTLRHGSTGEKAALVADIIKSYGVDITALDSVLAGQPAQVDPNAALADRMRKEMEARLQPLQGFVNQMQGRRQQAVQQINTDAASEVETFSTDGAHEFFEDVRGEMADIIDLYTRRGASISLQDAYDRAIKLHPQVSEIIGKRAEAERMNAAAAAAQRAKRTAASIGGSSAPAGAGPGPAGDDRRAAIEAAWDAASGS